MPFGCKGKDGENTQDSESGYSGKKAAPMATRHINVDGSIKAIGYTPGNEHGPKPLEKLPTRTGHQLYADKAYASAEHGRLLAKRNAANRILHLCPVGTRPSATSR